MNTPAQILNAFAERGLLIHPATARNAGMLAVTECAGAKLSAADTETIRKHKPALVAYLERERRAASWYERQPREGRAAIAQAAAEAARRTGTDASEAFLVAIEEAARDLRTYGSTPRGHNIWTRPGRR